MASHTSVLTQITTIMQYEQETTNILFCYRKFSLHIFTNFLGSLVPLASQGSP